MNLNLEFQKQLKALESDFHENTNNFEIGAWLLVINDDRICDSHPYGKKYKGFKEKATPDLSQPVRLIEKKFISAQPDAHIVEQNGCVFVYSSRKAFCLASPLEVENHLRRYFDKYIGKRAKCLNIGEYKIKSNNHDSGYEPKYDQYWMIAENGDGILVYERGKFAEILPDKKPLPTFKTRKDYEKFLVDYYKSGNLNEFLDQYDFEE